jgi:hypothetical protein
VRRARIANPAAATSNSIKTADVSCILDVMGLRTPLALEFKHDRTQITALAALATTGTRQGRLGQMLGLTGDHSNANIIE